MDESELPPPKKCFSCGGTDKVKSFNEKALNKCQYSLQVRKNFTLEKKDVLLPETITDGTLGYHPRPCYNSFNSINKKYKIHETNTA